MTSRLLITSMKMSLDLSRKIVSKDPFLCKNTVKGFKIQGFNPNLNDIHFCDKYGFLVNDEEPINSVYPQDYSLNGSIPEEHRFSEMAIYDSDVTIKENFLKRMCTIRISNSFCVILLDKVKHLNLILKNKSKLILHSREDISLVKTCLENNSSVHFECVVKRLNPSAHSYFTGVDKHNIL